MGNGYGKRSTGLSILSDNNSGVDGVLDVK